jgi:methyl-accepting chemotaxis protein
MFAAMAGFGVLYTMELKAQQSEYTTLSMVMVGLVLTSSLSFGLSLYHQIVGGAKTMVEILEQGARDNNLSHRLPVDGEDELARIAQTINNLLESFSTSLKNIDEVSKRLTDSTDHSQQAMMESSRLLTEQLNETNQLAAAIEEMSATAQEIAKSTAQAAEAANTTREATVSGSQIVSKSAESVVNLSSNIANVGERVGSLATRSEEVSGVLDVIKSVAEQTNLLALNAAIEAARAGEQGRGFAVVADEVRTLASRTQASAEEISDIVENLQAESAAATAVVKDCINSAESTVEQVTGLTQVLEDVEKSASLINDMTVQIAAASEEQVATSEHIAENVTRVDNMAKESSATINQLTEDAVENSELSASMKSMVESYKI